MLLRGLGGQGRLAREPHRFARGAAECLFHRRGRRDGLGSPADGEERAGQGLGFARGAAVEETPGDARAVGPGFGTRDASAGDRERHHEFTLDRHGRCRGRGP